MEDLFEHEQHILDDAKARLAQAEPGASIAAADYAALLREYGLLLRHLRRIVRLSDKTANELNNSKRHLFEKAQHDGLTGLYNRRFLDETLDALAGEAVHQGKPLAVFMLDVDFFKKYNDSYGHLAGDECLIAIAHVLDSMAAHVGKQCFAARYGGEEFVIVLPEAGEHEAHSFSEAILATVRELNIAHEANPPLGRVTVSVGVAVYGDGTACSSTACGAHFLCIADKALYTAKRNGRNCYTLWSMEGEK